ncbi:disks large-associated protein 5-like [Hetaerina americana]|uniref:disks large-associated protein 5-like n=1 Tax=Hetaerina americana TaxID=62018 RepID=UPI003A7F2F4B
MSELNLFRTVLHSEINKLRETCVVWEKEVQSDLPEHATGLIRSAIGKAQLLMNGKLKQFNRLIDVSTNGSDENVVTVTDLQGFWDLVSLEISDVESTFSALTKLKENDWVEVVEQTQQVQRAPLKLKNTKPRLETTDEHRIAAKKRLEEVKRKMKSNLNEKDTKVFEVPVFFSVRSPPRGKKEMAHSKIKDIPEAATKPITMKDFTPCMRVTRSMKKTLQRDDN